MTVLILFNYDLIKYDLIMAYFSAILYIMQTYIPVLV